MAEYQYHQACLTLPKMDAEEFAALRGSIRRGFDKQHPVVLFDGKVLDGRHRIEACKLEGIDPVFVTKTDIDPFDYVRREHAARRSWKSQEQKALVIGKLIEGSTEYQIAIEKIQEEANKARAEAANVRRQADGTLGGKTNQPVVPQIVARLEHHKKTPPNRTTKAKAENLDVNRGAVERAATIQKKSPELAEKVASGEITASAALREIRRQEAVALDRIISSPLAGRLSLKGNRPGAMGLQVRRPSFCGPRERPLSA
jgi:ParB-like chromosome segregation protein Spo0J